MRYDVKEQLKTYSRKFLLIMCSWFSERLRLSFQAIAWRNIYRTAETAVLLVKKVIYFAKFGCLNSSFIKKGNNITFFSFLRDEFALLFQTSVTDVSVGFRPPCWRPYEWAPAWRLHTNIYKFGKNLIGISSCCDLNLGESLCIFMFVVFSDSGLYQFKSFHFYFDLFWMAWHWKPAIYVSFINRADRACADNCTKTMMNHLFHVRQRGSGRLNCHTTGS